MDLYLQFNLIEEKQKTFVTTAFLRGKTEQWFTSILQDKLDKNEDDDELFKDYNNFKKKI